MADNPMAFGAQHGCDGGGVNSPRHGDGDGLGRRHSALSTQHSAFKSKTQLTADRCLIVNRGQFSQAGYGLGDKIESEIDFFRRILLSQAETNAGARTIRA